MSESSRGRAKKISAPRGRGRRTQAERDQISAAERERNRERDAVYAKEQNAAKVAHERAERDRRRREEAAARGRGRGRGGFMGDSSGRNEISSGPLSGGSVLGPQTVPGKQHRPWAPSKKSGGGRSKSSAAGRDTIPSGGSSSEASAPEFIINEGIKKEAEGGGYESSDMDEPREGQRRPIENISLLTDDEDDENPIPFKPFGAPVRLDRVEHRGRAVQVNADAGNDPVKTEDDDELMLDTPEPSKAKGKARDRSLEILGERPWRGVWQDIEETTIKEDPSIEEPAARARASGKSNQETETAEPKIRRTRPSVSKQPILFNEEERNEHTRELEDNEVMLAEFGNLNLQPEDARTYIFQFPPVVPPVSVQKPITIKDDPDEPSKTSKPAASGSSNKNVPIKIEEDDTTDKDNLPQDQTIRPEHLPKLESGAVGKFRVRKSGKVTMEWGGLSFLVQNGVTPNFAQSLVMVKMDEDSPAASIPGAMQGAATAFGQPRGKLVVQPDWDTMLGDTKGLKTE